MDTFTPDPTLGQSSATPGFYPDPSLQKGGGITPDQSAAVLGHSNGLIGNLISQQQVDANRQTAAGVGSFVKDMGNSALLFGESAVMVPVDIARGVMGQAPVDANMPAFGGTQKTIQSQSSQTASDVFEGKQNPLMGTLKSVGDTLGGALNFIGGGFAGKAAKEAAPVVAQGIATGVKDIAENRSTNLAVKRLASTGETMTKAEREAAIKEGRMTTSGKYTPSATESRAGELMKGKTFANPVKTVAAVRNEIASRGQEAETYLEQNAVKISNEEDLKAFDSARASSQKYMTPSESKAYEEQIGVFQNILKDYTKGGSYDTSNYYKALKDYESQVTANLPKGKEALLKEGGAARIQAAKDVRSVVRDMIGTKNSAFKGKMYDLASLYDAQDNVIAHAEQGGHSWAKRNPIKTGLATAAGGFALEQLGAEGLKKLTR